MKQIDLGDLRALRDAYYNAPAHIKKTRWYALTKPLLDKIGDPGLGEEAEDNA